MALRIEEIRESGLLELYVLGDLSGEDLSTVEAALSKYPELLEDISSIEQALKIYGKIHSVPAPNISFDNLINKPLSSSNSYNPASRPAKSRGSWLWPLMFIGALIGGGFIYNNLSQKLSDSQSDLVNCRTNSEQKDVQIELLQQISNPNNTIIKVDPTEKYPETNIYLHNDNAAQKAFLQIKSLPPIADNQSYQLWSLKDNVDPIPLDVFEGDAGNIFEVNFELNTGAYAITIEPKGGSTSPTLDNLIGVFPVS